MEISQVHYNRIGRGRRHAEILVMEEKKKVQHHEMLFYLFSLVTGIALPPGRSSWVINFPIKSSSTENVSDKSDTSPVVIEVEVIQCRAMLFIHFVPFIHSSSLFLIKFNRHWSSEQLESDEWS